MASGLVPNVFAKRTRSVDPPTDAWITWRRVLPDNPGAGGMFRGSVSCRAAVQVPSQCRPARGTGGRAHVVEAADARVRATTRRPPGDAATTSGPPDRHVRAGSRRRPAEERRRFEPGAAVARDEGAQFHVGAVRVVALQPGPDPRLLVPAVERRVFRPGELGLELLERHERLVCEAPHDG